MAAANGQVPFSHSLYTELEYAQKYGTPGQARQLMARHSYPKNFFFTLKQLGLVKGSRGEAVIWHLEDDWITENITVKSFTGGATAGATAVITLGDDNHFNKNGIKLSFPQERQDIEFPISRVKATITAKTSSNSANHTITIKPVDPLVTLDDHLVNNMTLALISNAWAEGTNGAKPVVSLENRYENYFQIFKKNFGSTGTGMTLNAPYSIDQVGNEFIIRNTTNTEIRHDNDISNALLVGEKSKSELANSTYLGHDVSVYRTGGAFDEATKYGKDYRYSNGIFGLDEFDDVANYQDSERIATDMYLFFMGNRLEGSIENVLMEFGATQNGVFNYAKDKFGAQDGFSAEDFFTWIGFRGIHKRGKNYLFKTLEDFNDPKGLGSAGYDYPDSGMIVPYATLTGKGKKLDTPSMGVEYREKDGYSRLREIQYTGGANIDRPTSDLDAKEWDFRTEAGGHWSLLSHWVTVRPQ